MECFLKLAKKIEHWVQVFMKLMLIHK